MSGVKQPEGMGLDRARLGLCAVAVAWWLRLNSSSSDPRIMVGCSFGHTHTHTHTHPFA